MTGLLRSGLLRSEWTKFRTVRGWVIGILLAPVLTVLLGVLTASGNQCGIGPGPGLPVELACTSPIGPGGQAVQDEFYFLHRSLTGNGSLTVRLTSLTGSELQPWSKAGIMIKSSVKPGAAYAAMMATSSHGIRFQYDFTGDIAGPSAGVPGWLRLVRAGDVITGYASSSGVSWTKAGAATLTGLPATVQVGMFATSPMAAQNQQASGAPVATGTFAQVSLPGPWTGTSVTRPRLLPPPAGYQRTSAGFTVYGSGDIAPALPPQGSATPLSWTLDGVFAGLIAAIVVGAMFITAEYRSGLIRTTLAASPGRCRVLAAKSLVLGAVTFVAGLIGTTVAIALGEHILRHNGNFIAPVPLLTEVRVVGGTAAVFALAAIFALAIGTVARRSAAAVTTAVAAIILPYLLAVATPAMPAAAADWLLRLTPTAAFAVQQTIPQYPQVVNTYQPFFGYYPLAPLAGFAVLCAWTAATLGLAGYLLCRRDA
jgi:ABC-type transport system involved in multi-copper enzyme maturation permease subunit